MVIGGPVAPPTCAADSHDLKRAALLMSLQVRELMQEAIDSRGGSRALYRGMMPRLAACTRDGGEYCRAHARDGRAAASLVLVPLAAPAQTADDADALFERAAGFFNAGAWRMLFRCSRQPASTPRSVTGDSRTSGTTASIWASLLPPWARGSQRWRALRRTRDLHRPAEYRAEQVDVLNSIGLLDYYAARYPQATSRFRARWPSPARRAGQPGRLPANNLGLVHAAWGHDEEAIENYGRAREEHEKRGDRPNAAANLGNIAGISLPGAVRRGCRGLSEGAGGFPGARRPISIINTLINIGMTASARGAYDDARASSSRHSGGAAGRNASSEAYALSSLGTILYATGRYDQAETAFGKALELLGSLGLRLNVASTTASLGMVSQAWGRNDKALQIYGTALSWPGSSARPTRSSPPCASSARRSRARAGIPRPCRDTRRRLASR